jgi:hypothetical protein
LLRFFEWSNLEYKDAVKGHAALAVTAEEIQLKNLVQAHKDINSRNATAAIDNIFAVLDWGFKDVHSELAKLLEANKAKVGSNSTINATIK